MHHLHVPTKSARDSEEFDRIARVLGAPSARRRVVVSLIGVLAASFGPISPVADARRRRRKKHRRATRPAPVKTCTGVRSIVCGSGCCSTLYPLCCPDIMSVRGTVCAPANYQCCTLAEGGGACPPDLPKCCPPTPEHPYYTTCNAADVTCCPAGTSGGYREVCSPGKACCPNAVSNVQNHGCCPALQPCCTIDSDCPGAHPCGVDGCCEV